MEVAAAEAAAVARDAPWPNSHRYPGKPSPTGIAGKTRTPELAGTPEKNRAPELAGTPGKTRITGKTEHPEKPDYPDYPELPISPVSPRNCRNIRNIRKKTGKRRHCRPHTEQPHTQKDPGRLCMTLQSLPGSPYLGNVFTAPSSQTWCSRRQ